MRGLQFAEDASPMAHPIRPDMVIEMNNFYTLTVYEKGAEVIRMIHTLLWRRKLPERMQLYFERHDGSAATCDFVQAMEDASNVDLSHFRCWYSQSGTPVVTVKDDYNPETEQYTLTISQRTPATPDQAENNRCIFRLPSNCMTRRQSDPVAERRSSGEFRAERHQAEQTFVLIMSTSSRCLRCCANSLRQ